MYNCNVIHVPPIIADSETTTGLGNYGAGNTKQKYEKLIRKTIGNGDLMHAMSELHHSLYTLHENRMIERIVREIHQKISG